MTKGRIKITYVWSRIERRTVYDGYKLALNSWLDDHVNVLTLGMVVDLGESSLVCELNLVGDDTASGCTPARS